jgi:uncharacterized membrane protein
MGWDVRHSRVFAWLNALAGVVALGGLLGRFFSRYLPLFKPLQSTIGLPIWTLVVLLLILPWIVVAAAKALGATSESQREKLRAELESVRVDQTRCAQDLAAERAASSSLRAEGRRADEIAERLATYESLEREILGLLMNGGKYSLSMLRDNSSIRSSPGADQLISRAIAGLGGRIIGTGGASPAYQLNPDVAAHGMVSSIEELPTREAMYRKVGALLDHARRSVIDTTWGPDAPQAKGRALAARSEYIEKIREVAAREVHYRELFTDSPLKRERLKQTRLATRDLPYEGRVLGGPEAGVQPIHFPVIDFLVVDRAHVILSHVRSGKDELHRFAYARSDGLATVLTEWFETCWETAAQRA